MHRRAVFLILALLLAACGEIGVPQVTPTLAPTRTATPSPEATQIAQNVATRTPFPTVTGTNTPTVTVLPTETSTLTATASPELSPTPSETPTPQPTDTATPSPTLTPTLTATLTPTPTDTNAPTATNTATATATATPTLTFTPTATNTATPSLTPTETLAPTSTPLPTLGPTATPTATATASPSATATTTPEPTATATATITPVPPTAMPTRTLAPTSTPDRVATAFAELTLTGRPTLTPIPATPTNTISAPTLDVTPTFVVDADVETPLPTPDIAIPATITPIVGEGEPQPIAETATPTLAPTLANVNPPSAVDPVTIPGIGAPDLSTRAFVLGTGGGAINAGGISNPTLFIRNPQNPNEFLATDQIGYIYSVNNGVPSGPGDVAPWGGQPRSREENNAIVIDAAWAPNGENVAFVVDSDRTGSDGVWVYQPGVTAPLQVMVDCRAGCFATIPGMPYEYETVEIVWSPSSDAILATLDGLDAGRRFIVVLGPTENYNFRPPALAYDYGDWAPDGRIVVSGRRPDGQVILGLVNRDGSGEQIVLDGSARGLWLQNGTQRPDGQLYALGRPGDPNGPMQIYDQSGTPRTELIGSARPVDVKWNQDRSEVYVQTEDGRKFLASINGQIREITNEVGGIQAVAWITGRLPPGTGAGSNSGINPQSSTGGIAAPPDAIPSGVIAGTRYQPGQQLRVLAINGLAVREGPSTNSTQTGSALTGQYVAILAGPVANEGNLWWLVQTTSDGQRGWIAGEIGGVVMLGD